MRVGNDGERCDFLSKTCFFRDSAVSENRENRTICKPGMFIFIFLINNDKEREVYDNKGLWHTDAGAGKADAQ